MKNCKTCEWCDLYLECCIMYGIPIKECSAANCEDYYEAIQLNNSRNENLTKTKN